MFEIGKKISGKKQNQKSDIHGDDEDRISVDDDDEGSEEDSEEDGDDDSDEDEEDEEDGSDDEDEDVDDEGAAIDDDEEDENEVENLDENRTKGGATCNPFPILTCYKKNHILYQTFRCL